MTGKNRENASSRRKSSLRDRIGSFLSGNPRLNEFKADQEDKQAEVAAEYHFVIDRNQVEALLPIDETISSKIPSCFVTKRQKEIDIAKFEPLPLEKDLKDKRISLESKQSELDEQDKMLRPLAPRQNRSGLLDDAINENDIPLISRVSTLKQSLNKLNNYVEDDILLKLLKGYSSSVFNFSDRLVNCRIPTDKLFKCRLDPESTARISVDGDGNTTLTVGSRLLDARTDQFAGTYQCVFKLEEKDSQIGFAFESLDVKLDHESEAAPLLKSVFKQMAGEAPVLRR